MISKNFEHAVLSVHEPEFMGIIIVVKKRT